MWDSVFYLHIVIDRGDLKATASNVAREMFNNVFISSIVTTIVKSIKCQRMPHLT